MNENTITHITVDVNSLLEGAANQAKAYKTLSTICLAAALYLYFENKKKDEKIKELKNAKGE